MATGMRKDPYVNFRFLVEISGVVVAGFSEVSGLQAEIETEDYREGGVNYFVHKLPKVAKYPNIVLKKGLSDSDILFKWYKDTSAGIIKRQQVNIIILGSLLEELRRWTFAGAYPVKWVGPDMKADTSAIAIESIELVHKGLI